MCNAYRQFVLSKLSPDSQTLANGVLGLCGEAGEVADLFKKHAYQGHILHRDALLNELGDVLFYWELAAWAAGITMDEAKEANMAKLNDRYPDGFDKERSIHRKDSNE